MIDEEPQLDWSAFVEGLSSSVEGPALRRLVFAVRFGNEECDSWAFFPNKDWRKSFIALCGQAFFTKCHITTTVNITMPAGGKPWWVARWIEMWVPLAHHLHLHGRIPRRECANSASSALEPQPLLHATIFCGWQCCHGVSDYSESSMG